MSGGSRTLHNYWSQWDSLILENRLLYRRFESPLGDKVSLQLVVPEQLKRELWDAAHFHPLSRHMTVKKTIGRIKEKAYCSGVARDVEKWCTKCKICITKRGSRNKGKSKLRQYLSGEPLQRVALDILGPLPLTPRGNKYILVIGDYFSKWTEAIPIPNQESTTTAKGLVEQFICKFGIPDELHSDQGRQFEAEVFQQMCRLLQIRKTKTTAYHQQSDGIIERFNRTLESMLSAVVSSSQKDWDTWLPYLSIAYNTAIHESTGFSPAEIMYGRILRTPVDVLVPSEYQRKEKSYPAYIECWRRRLEGHINKFEND